MSRYKANKQAAITFNEHPTKTDQSQVEQTDINIIVTQFLKTGQQPGGPQPFYGDFTELPDDLRGYIEMGRSIQQHKEQLPQQLQNIPLHELVRMTNEQINAILAPPDKPTDKPEDKPT